jgi:DNA modification methylase/superfamily II DNA or RNA helicase
MEFQKDMVLWALRRGRAALFAECGLGKTICQLEWGRIIAEKTGGAVLLLAPLAVAQQTLAESEKFDIPGVRVVESQKDVFPGINVTNYEKLHKFNPESFSGVVLDESSILKALDGKTRQTLTESFASTPYKLCCSATPAPNDFMELGNHSEFLNVMPRMQMLATFFIHDSARTSSWRLKGHAQEKFWEWVATWAMVVRMPSDIGHEDDGFVLPAMHMHTKILEADPDEGSLFAAEALSLNEQRAARKGSMEERVAICADMANGDTDQWIIWCDFNAESDALKKAIPNSVEVKGSDSSDHKEKSLLAFSRGEIRVLVTKPSIAGWGMNWQSCHNVAFCGISHSYEQFYQAIRRCWRFGQKSAVNVHVVIGEKEKAVLDNVRRKESEVSMLWDNAVKSMKAMQIQNINDNEKKEAFYMTDHAKGERWEVIFGDCVEESARLPDESIDFSVFSPPFSSLYTYSDNERDMGNNPTYESFESHFKFLIKELFRILKSGRNVSVHCMNLPLSKQSFGEIALRDFRGDIIRWFQDEGFLFHSEVCIWKDPVVAMQRTKALGLLWKQLRKDSTMSRQGVPDYLVTFRKPGENKVPVTHTKESFPVDRWQKWASPVWDDIVQTDTLNYRLAREDNDERHICPLQLGVIERAVMLWSNPGELVFTPFCGIGSEVYQSVKCGRRGLGIELKRSYWEQSVEFLRTLDHESRQKTLFDDEEMELPA